MDAKICDRCGKAYGILFKKFKVNGDVVGQMVLKQPYGNYIGTYDLCDDCARDLWNWMCNEQESEE